MAKVTRLHVTERALRKKMIEYARYAPTTQVIHLVFFMVLELNMRAHAAESVQQRNGKAKK